MTPAPKPSLSALLEKAWSLRWDQRVEECVPVLVEIKSRLGWTGGVPSESALRNTLRTQPDQARDVLETAALVSAVLRAQKQFDSSRQILQVALSAAEWSEVEAPFYLIFEKAIHRLHVGDFSSAWEDFLLASTRSRTPIQKLYALTNVVTCLESLGMNSDSPLQEALALLKKLPQSTPARTGVANALDEIQLRKLWHDGEMRKLLKKSSAAPESTQAEYLKNWIRALPYHRLSTLPGAEAEEATPSGNTRFYQRTYRFRTLQGILHPDDLHAEIRPSDQVDRVYLWTWRWLESPETFPVDRILAVAEKIDLAQLHRHATQEDLQLFRNALLWISLFDASGDSQVRRLLECVSPQNGRTHPLFDLEKLTVHTLIALRDERTQQVQDGLKLLRSHPLWKNPDLLFRELVESVLNPQSSGCDRLGRLAHFCQNSRSLFLGESSHTSGKYRLEVDLSRSEIRELSRGVQTVSPMICTALELLHSRGSVALEEFSAVCFGIRKYDSLIHQPKVANLLSRIRSLVGSSLRVGMKSGRVYSEGSWAGVNFIRESTWTESLHQNPSWRVFLKNAQNGEESYSAESKSAPQPTSVGSVVERSRLESLIGKSRSTTQRILVAWEKRGWVRREGRARGTRYHLNDSLRQALSEGRLP